MNKQRIFALCMALPLLLGGCAVRRDRGGEEETEKQLRVLPETETTGAKTPFSGFSDEEMQRFLETSKMPSPAAVTALPQSSTQYDKALAKQALSFCAGYTAAQQAQLFEALGFTVLKQENYDKESTDASHTSAYTLAKGTASVCGRESRLLVLSVRGTNGGEWFSNIDVAPSQNEETKFAENFFLAAQQIFAATLELVRTQDCPVLVCGHSRGGACADLLAYFFSEAIGAERVYGYTFAAPMTVRGAQENNLKDLDVSIPLGTFTCVTGVSGSGKSSLVNEIIYKKLGADLNRMKVHPGRCKAIEGEEFLDKVICIDQSPIGRTPRSNPATYTNLFNDIRDLFASTPDAKARGYAAGRFSFNVRGGRCEACSGDGQLKIEMHFLPDIYVPCEVCKGKRYNRETLEVHYKGKSIADVLEMTVEEALEFFRDLPKLEAKLRTLSEVGLGYIRLGQSSTTLSGGEAQRVKLATELSKRSTGRTIYILDEPTTGLHTDDVKKLLEVLQRLVDAGNTVLVIEHNLDVIKCADYLLDLGPEGGSGGGTLVTCGTPEEVAACEQSYTGQYLRKMLR